MKCPYCLETIQEGAFICPICKRDLTFFKPMAERFAKVEKALLNLKKDIGGSGNASHIAITLPSVAPMIALAFSILLAFFFTWVDWLPMTNGEGYDRILTSLSVAAPFFPALILGRVLPRVQPASCLLLGLVAGIAGFVQDAVLYAIGKVNEALQPGWSHYVIATPKQWYWSLFIYAFAGSLFFLTGGYAGQWSRGRSHPVDEPADNSALEKWLKLLKPYVAILAALLPVIIPFVVPGSKK